MKDFIAILDFGSQYAHLISKRIRHIGAYTRVFSPSSDEKLLAKAKGIILSGGPASVNSINIPEFNSKILELNKPILGLCFGHQLIAHSFGGSISNTSKGEFGKAMLNQKSDCPLWENISFPNQVWMSHHDSVTKCPDEFEVTAETETGSLAALKHYKRPIFTFQFHPEVKDTSQGEIMLKNFVNVCEVRSRWSMESFIELTTKRLSNKVVNKKVLMFLSGGVDSSVAFALLHKVLGNENLLGLYINNGFMRKHESEEILSLYSQLGYKNIISP
jgi:GMP synthase (glutamine-hydrolyzing), N-terminal domain or A subunit